MKKILPFLLLCTIVILTTCKGLTAQSAPPPDILAQLGCTSSSVCFPYISLQNDNQQTIPPKQWTQLTFNYTNALDDPSMWDKAENPAEILITEKGNYLWQAYISIEKITPSQNYQYIIKFVRNWGTEEEDDTGLSEHIATPGRQFQTVMWQNRVSAGKKMSVAVWHDNPTPITIRKAQFKAKRLP